MFDPLQAEAKQGERAHACSMAAQDGTRREICVPAAGSRQAFWIVPPIVLEHAVCMHFGNQHHVKVEPRVAFTRHSNGARGCLMAGCDGTWQEVCAAASFGVRSLPGCRATTITTICVTTRRAER